MRKIVYSISTVAIAATALFVWSQTVPTPLKANVSSSISQTNMTTNYKASLPIEQWDAN